ncbi:hypothetical protein BD560DRAFT_457136 [Blakeslea trispora]|nr:hypothetical protein BD560DRAFT_457136 [Blakeslea trispora]
MRVVLYFTNHLAEPENIFFDLHFREPTYTILHRVHFRQASPDLIRLLTTELEPSQPPSSIGQNEFKKRRTSPALSTAKKIKTPPAIVGSPAHDSPYSRYPASPSYHDDPDDVFRAIHGYKLQQQQQKDGVIIDHVYTEKDVDNVHMVHKRGMEDHVRKIWGIPKGLDMLELARRLASQPPEEMTEVETIILTHRKEEMLLEDNEDEFVVDLYSLGPDLLNRLWQYTEHKLRTRNVTQISPFSLVEANTNMVEYD